MAAKPSHLRAVAKDLVHRASIEGCFIIAVLYRWQANRGAVELRDSRRPNLPLPNQLMTPLKIAGIVKIHAVTAIGSLARDAAMIESLLPRLRRSPRNRGQSPPSR